METPVSVRKMTAELRLLESVEGGEQWGATAWA
jgi:hypothetical protein